ncbi:MAG: PilT/PilU family type 4a pilus ATPase, partial [Planctomycetales bacterium]|nr:PilT/PilU family type 4a pilus ATPase [Planctomycetales bacterium]
SFAELHLPSRLSELAEYPHGLVIVTGPTGSGKSTTLATVINEINLHRQGHVITIEDPIEYVHRNKQCLIQQRQLYTDVPSFASAVRAALREDPDVLLVGEMRDMATIRAAVTAAETGHLVFSTLHTGEAIGAIDRMISVFPAEEQVAVRDQLSRVLRCVVSQRLVARADHHGRVPAVEIMQVNDAVSNLIRIGQSNQIESVMQTGGTEGMMILEQSLAELTARRLIDESEAATIARDRNVYTSRLAVARQMFKAQAV